MLVRKYKAEQIVTLLGPIEVQMANGKTAPKPARKPASTPRPMTAGGRSTPHRPQRLKRRPIHGAAPGLRGVSGRWLRDIDFRRSAVRVSSPARASATAWQTIGLSILAFLLCLSIQIPGAGAEPLELESSDERPRWTPWRSVRPPGLDLTSIAFYQDNLHGWAVGNEGTILATTDGGSKWTEQKSPVDVDLNAVHVGGKKGYAWVAAENGIILKTVDGGAEWTSHKSPVTVALRAVHASADGRHVWAVGDGGTVVYSSNYGKGWTKQDSPVNADLLAVLVSADGRRALAAGEQRGDHRDPPRVNPHGLPGRRVPDNDWSRFIFPQATVAISPRRETKISFCTAALNWVGRTGLSGVYARLYAIRLSADGQRWLGRRRRRRTSHFR